jgi:hypothetical protein
MFVYLFWSLGLFTSRPIVLLAWRRISALFFMTPIFVATNERYEHGDISGFHGGDFEDDCLLSLR